MARKKRKMIKCKKCGYLVEWGQMGNHKKERCLGKEGKEAMDTLNSFFRLYCDRKSSGVARPIAEEGE
jgi:hypothetical protein